ncbi:MAG: AAA family ATPase [Candidatus Sungbacteria bacterium]|nr:AAA family ATPase [bacterium]MDZ4260499.1 AAA family ATPase [Candidatus Sungbacteria bacterium]
MQSSNPPIPIEQIHLAPYKEDASNMLVAVQYLPKAVPAVFTESPLLIKTSRDYAKLIDASAMKAARRVSNDVVLLTPDVHTVLTAVREGIKIGLYMGEQYTTYSGLESMKQRNLRGPLSTAEQAKFSSMNYTASVVAMFSMALYVVWKISAAKREEIASAKGADPEIPEFNYQTPRQAIQCIMFYYASNLDRSNVVANDASFIKMTLDFFERVMNEMKLHEHSLQEIDAFTHNNYLLAGTEFGIRGFDTNIGLPSLRVEWTPVELDEITGNHEAKRKAVRIVNAVVCFDFVRKMNPYKEIGGLPHIRLGAGVSGTGKSMLAQAITTLFSRKCEQIGVPFLIWPIPDTLVDKYQGTSAERMAAWMQVLQDPTRIIYATADDAENYFQDRNRDHVSEGVEGIILTFLRRSEGAYAIIRGNWLFDFLTNMPEVLDPAVLSRIRDRFYIDGAVTQNDFLYQAALWVNKYRRLAPDFVDCREPADRSYIDSQKLATSLAQVYEEYWEPQEQAVHKIFKEVCEKHDYREELFFAELHVAIKDVFHFTSRDLRNIHDLVDNRINDFDLPEEWFEKPDMFFRQDYDMKKIMLLDLQRESMKGLTFSQVRLQETLRYLDTTARIVDTARERRLKERVEELKINREALDIASVSDNPSTKK